MKTIVLTFIVLSLNLFSCDKSENTVATPTPTQSAAFNPNDYSEYFTCKAGDYVYNVGNNAGNTTSVKALKIAGTLYLTSSDGNFVAGSTPPMEVNLQLKNFDAASLKSYDVSGTWPSEILKFNHVSGDNYDTNNGVNTTPQTNKIIITKIENGFYTGTFSFTVYKVSNRATTLQVTQGIFKFKL